MHSPLHSTKGNVTCNRAVRASSWWKSATAMWLDVSTFIKASISDSTSTAIRITETMVTACRSGGGSEGRGNEIESGDTFSAPHERIKTFHASSTTTCCASVCKHSQSVKQGCKYYVMESNTPVLPLIASTARSYPCPEVFLRVIQFTDDNPPNLYEETRLVASFTALGSCERHQTDEHRRGCGVTLAELHHSSKFTSYSPMAPATELSNIPSIALLPRSNRRNR